MVKVGFLILAEGRAGEDVWDSRRAGKGRGAAMVRSAPEKELELVETDTEDVRDKADLFKALEKFRREHVDGCLIFVPIYISAALAAMAVRLCDVPCAVLGNSSFDTFSRGGYLASVGAIEQAGLSFKRVAGDIREDRVRQELLHFFCACHAKKALEGMTYGMFGGRSLGINTATADPAQWLKLFGIDMEQIDQLQIVTEAERLPQEEVRACMDWVEKMYGALQYKKGRFSEEHLEKMARSYLAVLKLAKKYSLDFLGLKCQPELSNGYVLQCMTVQLLNDPYDHRGEKKPFVCSCEADCDGALTMEILQLLSGGKPTALQDVCYYDDEKVVFANCGSSASWFAKHSDHAKENLKEVHLIPHSFGEAGGAATQFTFAPGTYTYARLFRMDGVYKMATACVEVQPLEREELHNYSWSRPTAVAKGIDADRFSKVFGCNHMHCVVGDLRAELTEFCPLLRLEPLRLHRPIS